MDFLKTIAPLLGTAFGGPLGGAAASFLADKLGIPDKTVQAVTQAIQSGSLTPEQVASIRAAEIDFQRFCEEHKLDPEKIDAADRANARDMQKTTGSRIPGILAVVIVSGFLLILVAMMTGILKVSDQQALLILLGALASGFGAVLNFYFGSSQSSQNKDATIKALAK